MADSRLRFGSSNSATPSKVPLARIESELYDSDFDINSLKDPEINSLKEPMEIPMQDQNHNMSPRNGSVNREPPGPPPLTRRSVEPVTRRPPEENNKLPLNSHGDEGYNPVFGCGLAYFLAAVFFLIGFHVKGLTLLPFPWVGNLLSMDYQALTFPSGVIILQFMWCGHFVRRFTEVLFVHVYKRKMPFFEFIGASVYYGIFGLWMGWSLNFYLAYVIPVMAFFIPGVLIFIIGEVGNCYCHYLLRKVRQRPSALSAIAPSKRVIPHGFLFEYVTSPHYLFEIVSWIGFYLATHTIAAGVFLLASTITLVIRALKNHRILKGEFNGIDGNPPYPAHRKALIPYIL